MLTTLKSLLCLLLFTSTFGDVAAQNDELLTPLSICWTGERIFVNDKADKSIKEIDPHGNVMAVYSHSNIGLGEFQNFGALLMTCGKDGLYVMDDFKKSITYYTYSNMNEVMAFSYNDEFNPNTRIAECGIYICVTGNDLRTRKTLHIYTKEFEYVKSIGDDLKNIDNSHFSEIARYQLAQTEVLMPDDQTFIIIRPAPVEFVTIEDPFGSANITKTERHDVIPKPWETEFMSITAQGYSVGNYYRIHTASMDSVGRSVFVIYGADGENTVYEFDYKTHEIRNTGVTAPMRSVFSNLVHHNGQSKYFIYDFETEKLTLKTL
jgi:hypothetical protein